MLPRNISVSDIPFSKLVKLRESDRAGYLFKIELQPDLMNHLGTFHAGVLFALAESTSGQFLLDAYGEREADIIPVIRKAEIRYSKPGTGTAYCNAELVDATMEEIVHELDARKRVMIKVKTMICDGNGERLFTGLFDWFVTRN